MPRTSIDRRSFVKQLGSAGVAVGAAAALARAQRSPAPTPGAKAAPAPAIRNRKDTMSYRQVAETGVYVSAFSIGTGSCSVDVLTAALDMGINLIHTALDYAGGRSVEHVATAIKGRTDKVHLAVKATFSSIEDVLKQLGIPSIDFVMFPRHKPDDFRAGLPEIKKQFGEWRDKGLVKYAGLTCHEAMAETIDVGLESGLFTLFMPTYGPTQLAGLQKQRDAIRAKKLSIMAMKTKGELPEQDYPSQISKILADASVATVCKGVGSVEQLEEWATIARFARTGSLWQRMQEQPGRGVRYSGCGMCGACTRACPMRLPVADAVRCIRYYHDAEKTPLVAREQFSALGLNRALASCTGCGSCQRACPQRLLVRTEVQRAVSVLGQGALA